VGRQELQERLCGPRRATEIEEAETETGLVSKVENGCTGLKQASLYMYISSSP
jgi:hypothetical protein